MSPPRKLLLNRSAGTGSSVKDRTTPLCLLTTRQGTVPHLTQETLSQLEPSLIHGAGFLVPFQSVGPSVDVIEKYGKGIASFYGLSSLPGSASSPLVLMTTMDPGQADRTGYHTHKKISLWNYGNRFEVGPDEYMDAVKVCRPDIFVALSDGETPFGAANKRVTKAVSKSLDFLDVCLKRKQEDKDALEDTKIFGAVQGGYSEAARRYSAEQTASRPVDGFLLEGFHSNGPDSQTSISMPEMRDMIKEVVKHLPDEKPRLFQGSCDPIRILDLLELGLDMFESSYAYHSTEEGLALVFPNKIEDDVIPENASEEIIEEKAFLLNIKDPKFKEDFSPLVKSCSCYTCRKHTRAYVNHLFLTKELLGYVLLMIHNLHHYQVFFQSIRDCIDQGSLDKLRVKIIQKCVEKKSTQ